MTEREQFLKLSNRRELAAFIGLSYADFDYLVRRLPIDDRYTTFRIPKRNATFREILAPIPVLKATQSRLAEALSSVYLRKASAHGYVRGVSIVDNAKMHLNRRWILNLDLEDFFPSITFGRVVAVLIRPPFELVPEVAIAVAQLACHRGVLPQGAPSSPILSNLVCMKLDSKLRRLANTNRMVYTRYCDDLTFSTSRSKLPKSIFVHGTTATIRSLSMGNLQPIVESRGHLGNDLLEVIEAAGFSVNTRKTRLAHKSQRQLVTGLVVNGIVPRIRANKKRELRALLHKIDTRGATATEMELNDLLRKKRPFHRATVGLKAYLLGQAAFVQMVEGSASGLSDQLRKCADTI